MSCRCHACTRRFVALSMGFQCTGAGPGLGVGSHAASSAPGSPGKCYSAAFTISTCSAFPLGIGTGRCEEMSVRIVLFSPQTPLQLPCLKTGLGHRGSCTSDVII